LTYIRSPAIILLAVFLSKNIACSFYMLFLKSLSQSLCLACTYIYQCEHVEACIIVYIILSDIDDHIYIVANTNTDDALG
jgi:hypothetical protein